VSVCYKCLLLYSQTDIAAFAGKESWSLELCLLLITLAYFLNLSDFLAEHGYWLLRKSLFLVQDSDKWGLGQKGRINFENLCYGTFLGYDPV